MQCFRIEIDGAGLPYDHIQLSVDTAYSDSRSVYFIHVKKLLDAYQRLSNLHLTPCDRWPIVQYEGLKAFLNPVVTKRTVHHPYMPRLAAHKSYESTEIGFLGRLFGIKPAVKKDVQIVFGNGRHRTYFAAFHGAEFIPFQVSEESAKALGHIIGMDAVKRAPS